MRLLTLGDSFTFGEELNNRNLAWPNLIASKLKYDLTNLAQPGSGNTLIVRNIIENIEHYDIVVIAWSHFARIEFADDQGIYDTWPGHAGIFFKDNLSFRTDLLKYISKYYNDSYLYRQYLINIILVQNYLKANNKKFIMLDAFGNTDKLNRRLNQDLIVQIDKELFLGWPDESMMDWTYGCALGPYGHFLEDGHKRVADKIYEHIRHLGWVS
jgi:lysophospholipase L1-like esterase